MIYTATITQKGQVTIPVDIRRFLGVSPYERVTFVREANQIYIRPAKSFLDLKGSVRSEKKVSNEKMDKAVLKHIRNQYGKK